MAKQSQASETKSKQGQRKLKRRIPATEIKGPEARFLRTVPVEKLTVEEAESIFNALAEGGNITMPFCPTFWAKKFGMLIDKFGVPWIINGELQPV